MSDIIVSAGAADDSDRILCRDQRLAGRAAQRPAGIAVTVGLAGMAAIGPGAPDRYPNTPICTRALGTADRSRGARNHGGSIGSR